MAAVIFDGMKQTQPKSVGLRIRDIFASITGRDGPDEISQIESAMQRLEAERAAAQTELAAVAEQRVQALLDDDDDACDRLDRRGEALHRVCERVEVALPALQQRLDDARKRSDQAARLATYNAAKDATRAAEAALRKYPEAAKQIVDILEAIARADCAVSAANAALPEDRAALAFVEQAMRGHEPERDEVLDETYDEEWVHVGTGWKVEPADIENIVVAADGRTGTYETLLHNAGLTMYGVEKRRYRTTRTSRARSVDRVEPLSTQITLPCLAIGGGWPFWAPAGVGPIYGPPDGKAVLAAVADARAHWTDRPTARPERLIEVERRPVDGKAA